MERDKCIRVRFTCTQGDCLLELRDVVAFLNSFVFSHVAIRSMCCCCTAFLVLLLVLRGPCSVPQMQHCFRSEALLSILPIRGLPCKLAHGLMVLRGLISPGPNGVSLRFHFCPDGFRVVKSTCVFGCNLACFFDSSMLHLCISEHAETWAPGRLTPSISLQLTLSLPGVAQSSCSKLLLLHLAQVVLAAAPLQHGVIRKL